jgi:hypothetical protein
VTALIGNGLFPFCDRTSFFKRVSQAGSDRARLRRTAEPPDSMQPNQRSAQLRRLECCINVTRRDIEIEFGEVFLTCFIRILSLWTHQKIEMEKFARTTLCFAGDCSKADSVWRSFVKEIQMSSDGFDCRFSSTFIVQDMSELLDDTMTPWNGT